MNNRR